MKHRNLESATQVLIYGLAVCFLLASGPLTASSQEATGESVASDLEPLPVEYLQVQGLRRAVRFYRPETLTDRPALVMLLHGSGGNGERFRRFTDGAFERQADKHGFIVAYPDALGGQWNDCRTGALYHAALSGIDDIRFLRAVVQRARVIAERDLGGVFAVGYSNGGHLLFRAALEHPEEFNGLAVIGAHLPVPQENSCKSTQRPVSIFIVSGTDDPINPWAGGEIRIPGGGSPGHALSAEATAQYFRELAGTTGKPAIHHYADRNREDGVAIETQDWAAAGKSEVVLMVMHGGGHTLPYPTAKFPAEVVGPTSRDLDGAEVIWEFFQRQLVGGE